MVLQMPVPDVCHLQNHMRSRICLVQVLSVVAQQLASIQAALRARDTVVFLSGREVSLLPCGVFVTMNPGYAGRIVLPDNLQALFRPMALMAPDSVSVAEVVLFWYDIWYLYCASVGSHPGRADLFFVGH